MCPRAAVRSLLAFLTLVALPAVTTGCSGNDRSDPSVSTPTIGVAGGRIVGTGVLRGTSVEVPPNALDRPVRFVMTEGDATAVPDRIVAGIPVHIAPEDTVFHRSAVLTTTYDPDRHPVAIGDFVVKHRDAAGEIHDLVPLAVDDIRGIVVAALPTAGTAWVTVPGVGAPAVLADYFPLGDGDAYDFDDGFTLRVAETANEPHLIGQPIVRLTWDDGSSTHGTYWARRPGGALDWVGDFGLGGTGQRIALDPARAFDGSMSIGMRHESTVDYAFYPAPWTARPSFFGIVGIDGSFDRTEVVEVPLGEFRDVIVLVLIVNDGPVHGIDVHELWLARGVGPVRHRINAHERDLVNAWVGGRQIRR